MLRTPRTLISTLIAATALIAVAACGDDPGVGVTPADADTDDALVLDTAEADTVAPTDTASPNDALADADAASDALADADAGDTRPDPLADGAHTPFLPTPPEPPEPLGCAHIINPGAEAGDLRGWEVTEGSFVAQDQSGVFGGNFPAAYAGDYYFRAGDSGTSRLHQRVDVTDLVAGDGPRYAVLTAQVSDRRGEDEASLGLAALDASGDVLAERLNGPYARDAWHPGLVSLALPPTTATLRLELRGVRRQGTPNDAYFDDLTLCVYGERPHAAPAELLAPPYVMGVTDGALTILFETRAPAIARVDFGAAPDALDAHVLDPSPRTMHQLRLTDLEPGARLFYRVSWADLELPPFDVLSAPAADDTDRIEAVLIADNQDGVDVFTELAAEIAALDPDLILHAGDAVQNGRRDEYHDFFFGPLFGLGNHAPMLLANGNHETYSSAIFVSDASMRLWEEVVDQPDDEHCFATRWGPLFVLTLDSEIGHGVGSPQYACAEDWLRSGLAQHATFRVVLMHRPPLVEYWDSVAGLPSEFTFFTAGMDAPDVRDALAPLFEIHGVHLVLNGHNHLYQYVPAWPATVTWVTAGGGGGVLESGVASSRVNDWSEFVGEQIFGRYHFLRIAIDGDVMGVQAIALGGEVLHTFTITR